MTISIVIPVYEMNGKGAEMLKRCLDSIAMQTFTDYEIVVTDNSDNDDLEKLCDSYSLPIIHLYNEHKGATKNTNRGIKAATGDLIKILNQDDYLAHENALQDIVDNFEGQWLITGCSNNPNPYYTGDIHQGNNKLGGPSVLTIKNENPMLFDEEMRWLFDCDYYKRMYLMYGEPKILHGVNVVIGEGDYQLTNNLSEESKRAEVVFMTNKYVNNSTI